MANSSLKLTALGPVTNVAKLLGQSGLTTPNVVITSSRLTLVSSNSNDNSTGTGARRVKVSGTNNTGATVSETVEMNGTTSVTTTASFESVNSMMVVDSGANGIDGDITLAVSGGTTMMIFKKDFGRVYDGVIMLDKTHYITHIDITGDSTDSNTIYEISIMIQGESFNTVVETIYWNTDLSSHDYNLDHLPIQGVVWIRCKNLKHNGPDNISVTLHFVDHLNHE